MPGLNPNLPSSVNHCPPCSFEELEAAQVTDFRQEKFENGLVAAFVRDGQLANRDDLSAIDTIASRCASTIAANQCYFFKVKTSKALGSIIVARATHRSSLRLI